MSNNSLLMATAMAQQCKNAITQWREPEVDLPAPLRSNNLIWMCENVERHVEEWPATKSHRWIGFVQCAMLAHGMLDLEGIKSMFEGAKQAHGDTGEDLSDHQDPDDPFELDIGGEG